MSETGRDLNDRMKDAIRNEPMPPYLKAHIRARMKEIRRRNLWMRTLLQVVAALVIFAVAVAYHFGHLRFTPALQESYIESVSDQMATLMKVGLGQHIRCAVFRGYPKTPPALETLDRDLGPEYQGLIPIVKRYVPPDYRVVMAHWCNYQDRKFAHLTLSNGTSLISLLITPRIHEESIDPAGLLTAVALTGTPVYTTGAQKFQVSAFESPGSLVYFVSDLPEPLNNAMMLSMTPVVQDFLKNLGS
jgi:hypothetical protein